MSSNHLRSLVRDLLNDTTVREKKPYTPAPPQAVPDHSREAKQGKPMTPVYVPPKATQKQVEVEREVQQSLETELDPNCSHKPQVKGGVKTCWLCGGAYKDERPVDARSRRDASTSWRAQVYGKKR